MEPFGLFQLLNSMLTRPAEKAERKPDTPTDENAAEKKKETPPPVQKTNAYLEFFERHEKRAKR